MVHAEIEYKKARQIVHKGEAHGIIKGARSRHFELFWPRTTFKLKET